MLDASATESQPHLESEIPRRIMHRVLAHHRIQTVGLKSGAAAKGYEHVRVSVRTPVKSGQWSHGRAEAFLGLGTCFSCGVFGAVACRCRGLGAQRPRELLRERRLHQAQGVCRARARLRVTRCMITQCASRGRDYNALPQAMPPLHSQVASMFCCWLHCADEHARSHAMSKRAMQSEDLRFGTAGARGAKTLGSGGCWLGEATRVEGVCGSSPPQQVSVGPRGGGGGWADRR